MIKIGTSRRLGAVTHPYPVLRCPVTSKLPESDCSDRLSPPRSDSGTPAFRESATSQLREYTTSKARD